MTDRGGSPTAPPNDLLRKVEDFARRLRALERELGELRHAVSTAARAPSPAAPPPQAAVPPPPPPRVPPAPSVPAPSPVPPVAAPTPPPKRPLPPKPPRAEPPWWSGLTFADLFTAKVLAWAGGVVTLLGVVFFFVLAVNRGWIGPVARVSLGAIASAILFSAGLVVRRRYGHLYYSAYGAVGAGIGGGYATLLAARLRYDLVSDWSALILAAAIAGVGTATALAWSSELIAGLGLIGATLAPAAVGLQSGELTAAGTGFAALVFAGTAVVAVGRRWETLLAIGVLASLPQAAVLIAQSDPTEWDVVLVSAVFWLLVLGSATALQLRYGSALASLPSSLALVSAAFAGIGVAAQFDGSDEGWMLLSVAAVYGTLAALLLPRRINRDLSALLGAVGLAVVAVALADLLSGPTLAIAWAAEAAVLSWLARRIDELRYQLAAVAYLVAALVHGAFIDAPLDQLYTAGRHPASGFLAFVGVAVGGAIVAYYARPWEAARVSAGILAPLEPLFDAFRLSQPLWRSLTGWTAALSALYVASLGVLELVQWLEAGLRSGDDGEPRPAGPGIRDAFEWGHVWVTALWAMATLATIALGHRFGSREVLLGGIVGSLGVTLQVVLFDTSLAEDPRRWCFLVLAAAAAALALSGRRIREPLCHVAALVSLLPLLVYAVADAPPDRLYRASLTPAANPELVSLIAFVVAAAIAAYAMRPSDAEPNWFDETRGAWRSLAGWSAAAVALYAASLGVLTVAEEIGHDRIRLSFEWGHVAVAALWGTVALGLLLAGHRRSLLQLRVGGLAVLGLMLGQAVGYFASYLHGDRRAIAFLVVAGAVLSGSLVDRLERRDETAFPVVVVYVLFSLGLALAGVTDVVDGETAQGFARLAIAALYCTLAAAAFLRDRDLSTLLWAPALLVAIESTDELLSGTWLVLAWAGLAAALVLVAAAMREPRLQLASLAYLGLAAAHALVLDGPPIDFFEPNEHPEHGVLSLLFVTGAALLFARYCDRLSREAEPDLGRLEKLGARASLASATALLIYAGSLAILGLAEAIGGGSVEARFHAGHSGVSALWGVVGLAALYAGLRSRRVWLQAAGFGLFAVSLAKIFLYDLSFLSSVTRALSFLAVGAVLLLGGFFVQRLGAEGDARPV